MKKASLLFIICHIVNYGMEASLIPSCPYRITPESFSQKRMHYLSTVINQVKIDAINSNTHMGLGRIYREMPLAEELIANKANVDCANIILNDLLAQPTLPIMNFLNTTVTSLTHINNALELKNQLSQIIFRVTLLNVFKKHIPDFKIPDNISLDIWGAINQNSKSYMSTLLHHNTWLTPQTATPWINGYVIMHAYLTVPL